MKPGDIYNTEGDILLDSNAKGMTAYAQWGVVYVTPVQAEKAKQYGWSLVAEDKFKIPEGLVGISRGSSANFQGG